MGGSKGRDSMAYAEPIRLMAAEGMATRHIAKELNISSPKVYRIADAAGIPIRETDRPTMRFHVPSIRDKAYDLPAAQAVEYLLGIISDLAVNQAAPSFDFVNNALRGPIAVIYAMLIGRRGHIVPTQFIYASLYRDRIDNPPGSKMIQVYISRLRKVLPPGEKIVCQWGVGYKLTGPDKPQTKGASP